MQTNALKTVISFGHPHQLKE